MKIRHYILSLLLLLPIGMMAQYFTSSPASRFGYGEINDNIPIAYRALGGVSTGMRLSTAINPSQPASYTACDSLSFMMDIAAGVGWTRYKDSNGRKNKANGNLEYVNIQVPLYKRYIALSAGVMPYSSVGYKFSMVGESGTHEYNLDYQGDGGLSQVYAGASFNLFDWVAVGANFYYMWGALHNYTALTFSEAGIYPSQMDRQLKVNSYRLRYGLQAFHTFAEKHTVVIGATFENKQKVHGDYYQVEIVSDDTIRSTDKGFEVPMYWSVGTSYNWSGRLTVAADFSVQYWSKASFFDQSDVLKDRYRLSVGAEYRHNPIGRNYADRMYWRVGLSAMNSYIRDTSKANDLNVAIGFGFPFRGIGTVLNTTIEYQRRMALKGMTEHGLRFTVGISINEQWFHKRKL
ncbi:MAG: hypothetical protein IJP52_04755 [Paludibacteraceae bacterium]|nr:hypothetical protein [Paludibacteraceae bacterium]